MKLWPLHTVKYAITGKRHTCHEVTFRFDFRGLRGPMRSAEGCNLDGAKVISIEDAPRGNPCRRCMGGVMP